LSPRAIFCWLALGLLGPGCSLLYSGDFYSGGDAESSADAGSLDGGVDGAADAGADGGPVCRTPDLTWDTDPPCAAATLACANACPDDPCFDQCFIDEPNQPACDDCTGRTFLQCSAEEGCRTEMDAMNCCVGPCVAEIAAWESCAEIVSLACGLRVETTCFILAAP